jgi:hypothetical protein
VNPNDDMKYQDVINTLRQLQQVKAPAGFEADLMRRINSESFPEERTFWQNIFAPSRLVPAAALAVTALLLIFVLNTTGVTPDNPLLTAPRERGDITLSAKTDNLSAAQKSVERDEAVSSEQTSGIQKDKGTADQQVQKSAERKEGNSPMTGSSLAGRSGNNERFITANFTSGRITDYPVNKAGLNFRQVNLSNEQKMQLNQLKQKLESMFHSKSRR